MSTNFYLFREMKTIVNLRGRNPACVFFVLKTYYIASLRSVELIVCS